MTVIVSSGQLKSARSPHSKSYPLPLGPTQYSGPSAGIVDLLTGDGVASTFEAMFRTQPMVFSVVTKLVTGISRLPINFFTYDHEMTGRTKSHDTGLSPLFARPFTRGSAYKLKAHVSKDLHIQGKALWVKYRKEGPGSTPTELWPVPWRYVQIVRDNSGPIGFRVMINAISTFLPPEEVVYFELPDGVSPLEPLRRTLALEDAAMTWQGESFRNGITPRGAFTTDQKLRPESLPVLRAELEKLYAGPENAGRFGLFDQGLKFGAMGTTAVDAELLGQRRLSREEVCSAYDVPPPLVGILDNIKGISVYELRKLLHDAISGKLVNIEETIQTQLIDPEPLWRGVFLEFDTSKLVAADPETQARTFLMEQQSSTSSTNERRLKAGLPRIDKPEADLVYMPLNMAPVGAPAPNAAAETDESVTSDLLQQGNEPKPGGTPEQGQTDSGFAIGTVSE